MGALKEGGRNVIDDLMPSQEDLLYEEELLRNPYSLKMWVRYLQARQDAPAKRRYLLFERALKALPGSYKVRPSRSIQSSLHCIREACAY
jgi:pre-mRNA-splicing factor SYF1